MATDSKALAKLSSDCSFLLTHLVREKPNQDSARGKLQSILSINNGQQKPILLCNAVGWYGSESTENAKIYQPYTQNQFVSPSQVEGVCFTESTLAGLKAHREIFKAFYGLAFDRDLLFEKGANPCLNIRTSLFKETAKNYQSDLQQSPYKKVHNFIPDQLIGFVNIIDESFDSTHEREWRILGNFEFSYSEIKFIFCPENEFGEFCSIQEKGKPPLFDLMWLDRI